MSDSSIPCSMPVYPGAPSGPRPVHDDASRQGPILQERPRRSWRMGAGVPADPPPLMAERELCVSRRVAAAWTADNHPRIRVSMDTTFSRWADACVPGLRTAEIRVDGQVVLVGDQAGGSASPSFHLPSPGLWAVWATPWGCPSGVVRPAARRGS